MLDVKGLAKTYQSSQGSVLTLAGISLSVDQGEFVSIIGPSGCGKSTFFNLVSGLERPDEGRILLKGREITGERGHVSYMLQKDLLLPWRSVLDNCILGMEVSGIAKKEAREKAQVLLAEFGLSSYADSFPSVLSGGMRQRAAFLRTMLSGREILLLDEPFGSLDAFTKSEMHQWLLGVWEKYHPTVLFITHDVEEALLLSDRIYVFSQRPAVISLELSVKFERPRSRELLTAPQFIGLKKTLLEKLFERP